MSNKSMPNAQDSIASSRLPELDGLRALAVASVIAFHCDLPGVFNAGFFGVDVFFAISGFIITALFLKEYRETGGFKFGAFYSRRIKRLLPPVLGLIALSYLVTPLVSEAGHARLKSDVPAALLYISNWWQISSRQPYFEAAATSRVLTHLWSLAIEGQFYLVWPPLAYFFLKQFGRKATGSLSLILAVVSTGWMWYLYDGIDRNRVYLGTDTHAMGLLAGAALACFWSPGGDKNTFSMAARHGLRIVASLSLVLLAYMMLAMNDAHPFMYRGSFLLVPILTCAIIYCTLNDPRFLLSSLLRTPLIQWIGTRSYSLYLVHWCVFSWMRLRDPNDLANPAHLAVALLLIGVVAEGSYQLLECRFRKIKVDDFSRLSKACAMGAYIFVAGAIFFGSMGDPDKKGSVQPIASAAVAPPRAMAEGPSVATTDNADRGAGAAMGSPADAGEKISGGEHIYAIGDSVLLGASDYLSKSIPGIHMNAAVGRQASEGLKIVRELRGKQDDTKIMLLHLGTNGYINEAQFKDLLGELKDRQSVLVINLHANRRWTTPNNEMIERMTHEYANVHLINWHAISTDRPEYFVKDGIHLTRAGILALATEIKVATGGSVIVAGSAPRAVLSNVRERKIVHKTGATEGAQRGPVPEMKAILAAKEDTILALSVIPGFDAGSDGVVTQPPPAAGLLVTAPEKP